MYTPNCVHQVDFFTPRNVQINRMAVGHLLGILKQVTHPTTYHDLYIPGHPRAPPSTAELCPSNRVVYPIRNIKLIRMGRSSAFKSWQYIHASQGQGWTNTDQPVQTISSSSVTSPPSSVCMIDSLVVPILCHDLDFLFHYVWFCQNYGLSLSLHLKRTLHSPWGYCHTIPTICKTFQNVFSSVFKRLIWNVVKIVFKATSGLEVVILKPVP